MKCLAKTILLSLFIAFVTVSIIFLKQHTITKAILRRFTPFSQQEINLLLGKVTSLTDVDITGWWINRGGFKASYECPYGQSCTRSFVLNGMHGTISSVCQHVPLRKNSNVTGFLFRFTTDVRLWPQKKEVGQTVGAFLRVKLNDGQTDIEKIERADFSPENALLESYYEYNAPVNKTISSVTVMLLSFRYIGDIIFYKIILSPRFSYETELVPRSQQQLVDYCKVPKPRTPKVYKTQSLPINNSINKLMPTRELLTMTTHLSISRLKRLGKVTNVWKGPVSLVIYMEPSKKNQDIHQIITTLRSLKLNPMSKVSVVYGDRNDDRYPINYLRNLALKNCRTEFCFIADADFQPSPNFINKFYSVLKYVKDKEISKTAFVIPAFHLTMLPKNMENRLPRTKKDLVNKVATDNLIQPFRIKYSPASHKYTNYKKWNNEDKPYYITGFHGYYEPYVILKKTKYMPKFDERFRGYGKNKISYIAELFLAKYKFMVTPENWMIHLPHHYSNYYSQFIYNPMARFNVSCDWLEFLEEKISKYHYKKCSLQ